MKRFKIANTFVFLVCSVVAGTSYAAADVGLMDELGEKLFFDKNLSKPRTQACGSCHDSSTGFVTLNRNAHKKGGSERGAVKRRAGNRRPPTNAYATFAGNFEIGRFGPRGGTFWDGRATGKVITDVIFPAGWTTADILEMTPHLGPAADQAMGPFLNDVEQNLPSAKVLCRRVKKSAYSGLYEAAWGEPVYCNGEVNVDLVHKRIAFAIAAFEASDKLNSFSSRRDVLLAEDLDGAFPLDGFTVQENEGHDLFYDPSIGCAAFCHSSSTAADGTDPQEIYVRNLAGYFNIGVPRNPKNPWYKMDRVKDDNGNIINPLGKGWVDLGIAFRDDDGDGVSDFPDLEGHFKVPTMRNVGKKPHKNFIKSYMHNGYFKSIKGVVHFYNTRDMKPACADKYGNSLAFITEKKALRRGCWPQPEVLSDGAGGNAAIFGCDRAGDCKVELADGETFETWCDNHPAGPATDRNIGNLCLSEDQEKAIVSYLEALSDQKTMAPPKKWGAAKIKSLHFQ